MTRKKGQPHPMLVWGEHNGVADRKAIAKHFKYDSYGVFRQTVTGHTGPSFKRAQAIAKRSGGLFTELDVMFWHQINGKY